MIDAIGSEIAFQYWAEANSGAVHRLSDKVSEFISTILPEMMTLKVLDADRVARAFSYIALKIEDIQYIEKFALAYQHRNIDALKAILGEMKRRPESFLINQVVQEFFEGAIHDDEDVIVDLIWAEAADSFDLDNAFSPLEDAVRNKNPMRAQWILDNFDIDPKYDVHCLVFDAIDNDMFFVVETLISRYEDDINMYQLESIFKELLQSNEGQCLAMAKHLWPKVKNEVNEYSLRDQLGIAKQNGNQPMVEFLNSCLKEKGQNKN